MGLFDFRKEPAKIADAVFGELKAYDGYFISTVPFQPLNIAVECIIDADKNGPTEEQRNFYTAIESSYAELRSKIKLVILDTFRNWKEDFEISDFDKEFLLSSISLPRISSKPTVWEICYTSIHDEEHYFTITVKNLEPEKGAVIDG